MSQEWQLVRTIMLEGGHSDVTIIKSGTTPQSLEQMKLWNGDTLDLQGDESTERVRIRVEDLGHKDCETWYFELQAKSGKEWKSVNNIEPVGSHYESTGDPQADYRRNRKLDLDGRYQ